MPVEIKVGSGDRFVHTVVERDPYDRTIVNTAHGAAQLPEWSTDGGQPPGPRPEWRRG
jgi:hypothetical protein